MTQNNVAKKVLTVGIILLFLTIGFSPLINAHNNTTLTKVSLITQIKDVIPITVLEYKPDGTIEKTTIRMSREQANAFREEMRNAQDLDIKLSIYKKYNFISGNITVDVLRKWMEEKSQRFNLLNEIDHSKSNHIFFNLACSVSGYCQLNYNGWFFVIPFGTSLITMHQGRFSPVPSVDVIDYIIGACEFRSIGLLGSKSCGGGIIKMVGFVGFMYTFWHNAEGREFDGFSLYVRGISP